MNRKILTSLAVGLFTVTSVLIPVNAYAVKQGGQCDTLNKKVTQNGISYVCKRGTGRMTWQQIPLTQAQKSQAETRKQKARADCIWSLIGVSGWSNDDLVNATYICTKRIP
jgi:hypothetical protein